MLLNQTFSRIKVENILIPRDWEIVSERKKYFNNYTTNATEFIIGINSDVIIN